jgi:hypothetical protein
MFTLDLLAQGGNLGPVNLYTVPVSGTYRMNSYIVLTRAATVSSTLPNPQQFWTDALTGVSEAQGFGTNPTANTVGAISATSSGTWNPNIRVQAGTAIQYGSNNWASSGATSMQYAYHIVLEYVGP